MIKLSEISTRAPEGLDKKTASIELDRITDRIAELSEILAARKEHSILVVFQGMDSSGKDGATEKVFRKVSPSIASAVGYKKPTDEEFAHDFLWRIHKNAPGKGQIKIFVRSHYEDVLIQRVHGWISEEKALRRIRAINDWERLISEDANTIVLKFYLHLSKERQQEKLQERIDMQRKNWKHNVGDWEARKHWNEYRRCYEDAINRSEIPWIIAPVDQRWYRNYFIASKVLEAMEALPQDWPIVDMELPS